jgi:hypothetical protein
MFVFSILYISQSYKSATIPTNQKRTNFQNILFTKKILCLFSHFFDRDFVLKIDNLKPRPLRIQSTVHWCFILP